LKLLNFAPARSHGTVKETQKKVIENTIKKISLIKISYFKCDKKNHLKRDYPEKKT
jgi:hypothetical protein